MCSSDLSSAFRQIGKPYNKNVKECKMFDFIIKMIADIFDGMTNAHYAFLSDIGGIQKDFFGSYVILELYRIRQLMGHT